MVRRLEARGARRLILRDGRSRALLRMRRLTTELAAGLNPRRGLESHDVKQPLSFPRRVFCARVLHLGFVPTGSKGGRSADRRLFVIVVAPASASVGRAGDARVASCEAAPDALAFRRSTVAVARHAPLRLRIISGNALNERDANLLLRTRFVVKLKMRFVAKEILELQPSPHWQQRQGTR
jgi:hypothetical protein